MMERAVPAIACYGARVLRKFAAFARAMNRANDAVDGRTIEAANAAGRRMLASVAKLELVIPRTSVVVIVVSGTP